MSFEIRVREAQLSCYFEKAGDNCLSYFFPFLFFLKIIKLLNIYEELGYI